VSARDLGRVYGAGAIYRRNDVEFGVRCDRCGCPIAVRDWEWHAEDDSPFVEDIVPPRLCRECARAHDDVAKGFP
jgi:hypothetical protein